MNERLVEEVLADGRDDDGPTTYQRVLRTGVFCALAFLAVFTGSLVAGAVVPLLYPEMGFEAGHVTGVLTAGIAVALLRRSWGRIGAVLPDADADER